MEINKKYNIIYADPPWHFKNWNKDNSLIKKGLPPYPTMNDEDIKNLYIQDIAQKMIFSYFMRYGRQRVLDI